MRACVFTHERMLYTERSLLLCFKIVLMKRKISRGDHHINKGHLLELFWSSLSIQFWTLKIHFRPSISATIMCSTIALRWLSQTNPRIPVLPIPRSSFFSYSLVSFYPFVPVTRPPQIACNFPCTRKFSGENTCIYTTILPSTTDSEFLGWGLLRLSYLFVLISKHSSL